MTLVSRLTRRDVLRHLAMAKSHWPSQSVASSRAKVRAVQLFRRDRALALARSSSWPLRWQ